MTDKPGANITLLARQPSEMEAAQNGLVEWINGKMEVVKTELAEAEENYEIARKNKWRSRPFLHQVTVAKRKMAFYEKIRQALEAGYYIVPPFPVDLFAIRTDNVFPHKKTSTNAWTDHSQSAKRLPAGKGDYVSPEPEVMGETIKTTDREGNPDTVTLWSAEYFQQVDFPFKLVKPAVLEQVSRAVKDKIFDQLGALPAFAKADPIIVGQILHYKPNRPPVTFFVSWWLDTADL